MASYGSYKKIISGQILDGTVPKAALQSDAGLNYFVKWVYGTPSVCSPGCCCLWTVPNGVRRVTFEIWEQAETDTVHVHVTAATTTKVLVVDTIIVRLLVFRRVGHILSVLLVSIAAVRENVQHVRDVTVM